MLYCSSLHSRKVMQTFVVSIVTLLVSLPAHTQTFSGSVVGRIIDAQDAVMSGARVTLHSVDRGFERQTTTDREGQYAFELVQPGRYTVRVEAEGFAAATVRVEVVVATPIRADLDLRVEPLKQSIEVKGEGGIAVQTEDANLGRTISPHEMSDLPSLTRSPYDFIALIPGAAFSNDLLGVGFSVNGARTQSANYLLDGSENNDTFMSAPAQDVPLDSIEEFNVQTNHFSAEYGRNSGFTTNIITKAGTDELHGSVYDYIRNSALAANTYDGNAQGFPRPVFNRHQFGGTLGGPISRRRLFFFASAESVRVRSKTTNSFFVPTPQLLAISAPGTQAIFQTFPLPNSLSNTNVEILLLCPFAAICDPQSHAGFVTIPAFASTLRLGPQNVGAGPPQNTILGTGRLDWVINSKMQAFARYAVEGQDVFATVTQPYSGQLDVPQSGRNHNITLNLIRTWSPDVATESRFAYGRVAGVYERFGANSREIPFPAFSIANESAVLPAGDGVFDGLGNVYQFFQTVTSSYGHHLIKFGAQFIQLRDKHTYGVEQTGDATFSDAQGFVNGVLQQYEIALNPNGHLPGDFVAPPFGPPSFTRHFRYNEPALFVKDTWRVLPRVTLTPGLRWEYFGVLHSPGREHDLDSNFYLGSGSTQLQQIASGRFQRTVDAPGDFRDRLYLPDYRNFAPRLGIAYDPFGDGKSIIRAGVGIFYDRRVGWELFRVFLNPPSYSLTQLTNIPVTQQLLLNPYAALPHSAIQLTQSDAKPIATNLRSAYSASWNVTVEHNAGNDVVVGASYLGSSGSGLYSVSDVSRAGSGGLLDTSCITTRLAADGVTPLGPDYRGCPGLNSNVSALGLRGNGGHSTFHALELKADSRRLAGAGLEFGANYTWSHSIDNLSVSGLSGFLGNTPGGYLDAFNPSLDRGDSDFDVRHLISAYWIWDIPLGRNSQTWKHRYLLGGWTVSGLASYQTGQPFSIADTGTPDFDFKNMNTRPRLTGPAPRRSVLIPDAVSPNHFLFLPINQVYDASGACISNTAPFGCEISVNGPFNNILSRNTFRQPGIFYQNTALLKNIPLPKEQMKLQIRAEFYNIFNHPNLYINGGTNDVNASSFNRAGGQTVPGVTASFKDSRQVVVALKLIL
jgi:Carboxypeptidase regulatory-like domain/TonB-dependent Receptor Plug Domain